jgi:hypothetical protein
VTHARGGGQARRSEILNPAKTSKRRFHSEKSVRCGKAGVNLVSLTFNIEGFIEDGLRRPLRREARTALPPDSFEGMAFLLPPPWDATGPVTGDQAFVAGGAGQPR